MDQGQVRRAIDQALSAVVPGVVLAGIDGHDDLRAVLDLDSIDFLALVENLADLTGVEVPEADYARVGTLDQLSSYLLSHAR